MTLLPLLVLGCSTDPGESAAPGAGFSVVTSSVEGGALLSAWSEGNALLMVGGQIGGGSGILARLDDDVLCVESDFSEKTPWWIHGEGNDWVAVGEAGLVVYSHDGTRTREDVPTEATLYGAWMEGSEVIAVGGRSASEGSVGEVWRRRDGAWTALATDLPGAVYKAWNGVLVGDGVAYTYDGESLAPVDFGGGHLLTVRGRDTSDVYAVGGLGQPELWHYDGRAWTALDGSALGQPLNGVWTAPGEPAWVAGNFGVVGGLDGDEWILPDAPLTADHLHAAWKHGDSVYFVGGNLFDGGEKHGTILRYGEGDEVIEDCGELAALPGITQAHAATAAFPASQLTGPTGTTALLGKPAVVNFWASWCAPCLEELPLFDQLSTRLSGVAPVVAVSVDTAWGPASGVIARLGLKLPLAHDPKGLLPRALSAPSLPATYVIDAQGQVHSTLFRAITAADVGSIEAQVRALVSP